MSRNITKIGWNKTRENKTKNNLEEFQKYAIENDNSKNV